MAIIVVKTDDSKRELMNEEVHDCHLEDEHSSLQVITRIAWAVNDADELCKGALGYRAVPAG